VRQLSKSRTLPETDTAAIDLMQPRFFRSATDFRHWLEKRAAESQELLVGYYKVGSGKPSMTWPQSVDQALCFGWIDGVRRNLDETRYTIRFTPRKPRSVWSEVNIKRVAELSRQGLMQPAGLEAFEARRENRSGVYSYEKRPAQLPGPYAGRLQAVPRAREFFADQAPSYRRAAIWWVISARQEATRLRRLGILISDSEQGRRIKQFVRKAPVMKRA
jgi:uncharacterized protein YdeI (YjbR/CyaY-like superfamily)